MDLIARVYLSAIDNRAVLRLARERSLHPEPSSVAPTGGLAIHKVVSGIESVGRRLGQLTR